MCGVFRPDLERCSAGQRLASGSWARLRLPFTADDTRSYRFIGEKRVKLASLRRSMSVLPGRVLDDAGEVVAAEVTFDIDSELREFLRSFRLSR